MEKNSKIEGWEALRRARLLCAQGHAIGVDFATVHNPRIIHVESARLRHDRSDTKNGPLLVNFHDEQTDEDFCCFRCLITAIRLGGNWFDIYWQ